MDWTTHQVFNQFPELGDYDPLASDPALCEALARADAGWARPALDSYARRLGRAETYTLAQQANRHAPELHRFDTRGRRIDAIEPHQKQRDRRDLGLRSQLALQRFPAAQ